jgi:hypothetical protein
MFRLEYFGGIISVLEVVVLASFILAGVLSVGSFIDYFIQYKKLTR